MPPALTADTGVDALTHALEAVRLDLRLAVHRRVLPAGGPPDPRRAAARRTRDGDDLEARTDMANAATIAGLAFSNAFVGVNHALAHAVGARFGIAHGRANAHLPAARAALQRRAADASSCRRPGYSAYVAPEKYAQIGLGARPRRPRRGGARASGCSPRVDELLDDGRHAALAGRRRASTRDEFARGASPSWRWRAFARPEPAHQPAHAAASPSCGELLAAVA